MEHLLGHRPSGAMVVAIVALVVAASGTAVAATHLVSGDSLIKKNSLSGNRLRARSVTGNKIRVSSLGMVPSARHATTADSATNATNATNATTATNAANATNANTAGSAPIAKVSYVASNFSVPDNGTPTSGTASCPPGTTVTGGGATIGDTLNSFLINSAPNGKTGWTAVYADVAGIGGTSTATIDAICAPAAATAP